MMSSGPSDQSSSKSEEQFFQPEPQQHPQESAQSGEIFRPDEASLDSIVVSENVDDRDRRLRSFIGCADPAESIEIWLGRPISISRDSLERLAQKLNRDVALIDELLNHQINVVLHHPRFQKLESSWRGLELLHKQWVKESSDHDPQSPQVKIRVLDVSWKELESDFRNAGYVEQSAIFDKVYEQEFGTYGGEPFGLLVGDYEVDNADSSGEVDDLFVMENMAAVAASAFSPFLANSHPFKKPRK